MPVIPMPPEGLRPGQLGVVAIGRVIIGDIAATLVDLAARGYLRVEQDTSAGGGWLVTAGAGGTRRSDSLLEYEQIAVTGISPACKLSSAASQLPHMLDDMRNALTRDAVHRGWLKRLHHDERTDQGEQLALRIRAFQRQLRSLKSTEGTSAYDGRLLPYALHFGLTDPDQNPLTRFANAFAATFADLPGWRAPEHTQAPISLTEVGEPMLDRPIMQGNIGLGAGIWLTGW